MRPCRPPRIAAFQQVRRFHQTRPAAFIGEVVEISSGFVHGVHSISGLPWVLSIPLTALVVRTAVALPLQIYTKIQAHKERDLSPILQSWMIHYRSKIRHNYRSGAMEKGPISHRSATKRLSEDLKRQQKALYQRWGVSPFWRPIPFIQLPVWMTVIETLRAMSGAGSGLIQYFASLFGSSYSQTVAVEPSLAVEGALWFPDLLAGDWTGVLPATLALSILMNIHMGWKTKPLRGLAELPLPEMTKQLIVRGVRLIIQAVALNIGLASYSYEMPAAVMIYWISSTNLATLQTVLLEKYMFPTPSLKPWSQIYVEYGRPGQKASLSDH